MPDPSLAPALADPSWAKVATDWALFALGAAGTGIAAGWAWHARREHARQAEILAVRDLLASVDTRLSTVEHTLAALPAGAQCAEHTARMAAFEARLSAAPGKVDVGNLHRRIDDLSHTISAVQVQVGEIRGEVHASNRLLQTIDAHLRTARP